jgi:hypothetical protein
VKLPRAHLLAAVAALAVLAVATPAQAATTCGSRDGSTIVATKHGRIFEVMRKDAEGKRYWAVYGCLKSVGVSRRLGYSVERPGKPWVVSERLEGRYASFVQVRRAPFDKSLFSQVLVEVDLRTGATVFVSDKPDAWGTVIYQRVQKANGSLAFFVGSTELRRFDGTGYSVLERDETSRLNESYLELSADRRTVSWRRLDETRSAPID